LHVFVKEDKNWAKQSLHMNYLKLLWSMVAIFFLAFLNISELRLPKMIIAYFKEILA